MIYIVLNVIFNAFMLFIILLFGVMFSSSSHKHIYEWILWDTAFVVSACLTIIGYTRFATFAISIFIPGRKMIGREKTRIEPLLSDVIEETNKKYGSSYRLQDLKIKVSDEKIVNAVALGYNTIVVNRGALNAFNDEQLRAILAHEMGHLFYRDSVRSIALIFSSFATRVVMWLYSIYIIVAAAFGRSARGDMAAMSLFSWIPVLIFLPVVILNWVGGKIFHLLNMAMSRGAEYRSDAFAASLGYKADMISALEVMDSISNTDNSFIAKLVATHPAPMQRIGALEDEKTAKKKMGNLFIGTALATNRDNVSGGSEIMRLVIILVIIGVGWGSLRYKDMLQHKPVANVVHTLHEVSPVKK
jgi:Zn-dependent protease with chaperone function